MSHADHIQALEAELEQAKRDAQPSIVIVVDHSQTEHTTQNLKTGTVRVDQILERSAQTQPIVHPPVSPKPIPGSVAAVSPIGEVVKDDGNERVQKLSSGTIRTDITRWEEPKPVNYWSA